MTSSIKLVLLSQVNLSDHLQHTQNAGTNNYVEVSEVDSLVINPAVEVIDPHFPNILAYSQIQKHNDPK